jgi:predicted ribonuclease YlaK
MESILTTGLRGRTLHNTIVIQDEWQNASQATAQKVLTRTGKNCKVIVTGSQNQIDSKYVTKYNNGLAVLMGEARERNIATDVNMFAIELTKVVRSEMALFAEELFTKKGK